MAKKKHIDITADTTQAKATINELKEETKKSMKESAKAADKSSKDIAGAYKKMGIRTDASIRKSTKAAKDNYATIKRSGTASANEIKKAHNKMTAKIKANNIEMRGGAGMLSKMYTSLKTKFVAFAAVAAAAAVTFATFTFGKKALTESIKFESALIELQKVMDDSEGSAKRFTGTVDKMAKKYGVAGSVILQGAAQFKQAGFDLKDVFDLQAVALELVIVGNMEAAEASDLLVASLKGFKAPASDARRYLDVMNEVSNRYGTSLGELIRGMADFSPVARKMGLSVEEAAGMLTPVIEVFRSGTESAQALRTGFLKLFSSQAPVQEALKELSVAQKDANGELRKGEDILRDVAVAFIGLTDSQKIYYGQELTGLRQSIKVGEVFENLNNTLKITQVGLEATGSGAKETAIQLGSTEVKGNRMISVFSIMARKLGDDLKPAYRALLDLLITTIPLITPVARFFTGILAAAFNTFKLSALGVSQIVLYITKSFTQLSDYLGITNNATSTLNVMVKDLEKQMEKTSGKIEKATRKALGMATAEDKLTDATKKSIAETKKKEKALAKQQDDAIKNYKESTKLAAEESKTRLEALKKQEDAQKAVNKETRKRISDAKQALTDLRSDITAIDALLESIRASMAAADVTREQQGLTSAQVLIDNVNRAVELTKQADKAFKEGRRDEAIALTQAVIDARNAVASANKLEMQEAGISPAGLDEARELAERLAADVQKMATTFSELQTDKIPGATEKIAELEVELTTGKEILKDYVSLIKEATTEATALKDKLSLDTTATHTQIIKTVQAQAEGGPVGAYGNTPIPARTGRHFPGYGGGDKIPILGEAGEFMMRKEAVRDLGLVAARAFNNRDIPALLASLTEPVQRMKEGGPVKGPSETVNLNLTAGGNTLKTTAPKDPTKAFVKGIKRMNIVYGRQQRVY